MMPMRCPTGDEIVAQAIALLPRGRAWQTHESGPRPGSVLFRYWRSVSESLAHLCARLCDLRLEFWCATHVETRPEWLAEYGLPDDCDPYPDLCAKVAALGGATCDFYREVAARSGWDVDCDDSVIDCGELAGALLAGPDQVGGGSSAGTIRITVYPLTSPAYVGPVENGPMAGCFLTGLLLDCEPGFEALRCVLGRVIHGHVRLEIGTTHPRTTLTDAPLTADSGNPTDGAAP